MEHSQLKTDLCPSPASCFFYVTPKELPKSFHKSIPLLGFRCNEKICFDIFQLRNILCLNELIAVVKD